MPKTLTTSAATLTNLTPVVSGSTVIGLLATVSISLSDGAGGVSSSTETFDVWSSLSGAQQTNFQSIYTTILATINTRYLV
jgi:hypothetical protein